MLYGFIVFVAALVGFLRAPAFVHGYLQARARQDVPGKALRILTWGGVTNERAVVVMLRVVLAIFIVLGALVAMHGAGLRTWIFDT